MKQNNHQSKIKSIMQKLTLFLITTFFYQISFCQTEKKSIPNFEKKQLVAKKISNSISIDGVLNEAEWQDAQVATDFVMFQPDNGKPLDDKKKTEVRVLYTNEALYIGATLNDDEPNKIMREITQRDDDGTSDFFGISVNGYNDGQQEFRFFVTAAGVQLDANANSLTGEDFSWNAIWDSEVKITNKGWNVEIKLPYPALRFAEKPTQLWGIQFLRQIRRDRQLYTWNFVDNQKGSLEQQSGELSGLENIQTPTRLFFFPYISTYVNQNKEDGTKTQFKGGLDIKYGINDAFTLDAILIPDFGQTAFDNKILNLGPFEQQFNENRPFFNEGTELFNKADLFYSRRIGGSPNFSPSVGNDEKITENPSAVNLLNALKISGRTQKGLGIGILNAVTEKTEATLTNTKTGEIRKAVVQPLTNYNITVFDQRFNKNSSVSFINTNVTRNHMFRDGNVSAVAFDLNTKKNTWNLGGDVKYSYINSHGDNKDKNGINSSIRFGETSGKIRFGHEIKIVTKEFDNNDLGINFRTNFYSLNGNINLRSLQSTNKLNSYRFNFSYYKEFEIATDKIQNGNININGHITTKKNDNMGMGLNFRPYDIYDFYQARSAGRYFILPDNYSIWYYISTNYNRKFAIDFNPYAGTTNEKGRNEYGFNLSPRYRFSNKLLFVLGYEYSKENNSKGYYTKTNSDIIFEQRDVITSSLFLNTKYAINNTMTINMNTRYYWSYVEHKQYEALQLDGMLGPTNFNEDGSQDFSAWNLDCSYSWWIAPGSQLNVLYRNNSSNSYDGLTAINKNLGQNFNNLFGDKLNHTFSISLRYFLDFNRVKNWL